MEQEKVKRVVKTQWKKGVSGNPKGKAKGKARKFNFSDEIWRSMRKIERKRGKKFLDRICELAFDNSKVAVDVFKSIKPKDFEMKEDTFFEIIDKFIDKKEG
jgi:hypothetical protein